MTAFAYVTLDVFTDRLFGGNQLAVFPDARGIPDTTLQDIAREFNFSETTFCYPPANPAHAARVRIGGRNLFLVRVQLRQQLACLIGFAAPQPDARQHQALSLGAE